MFPADEHSNAYFTQAAARELPTLRPLASLASPGPACWPRGLRIGGSAFPAKTTSSAPVCTFARPV